MPTPRRIAQRSGVSAAADLPTWAIRVNDIEVAPDRLIVHVEVSTERFAKTTPALIAALLPDFPTLLQHACVNDKGETFMAVAAGTSTPHLLEHMAIDMQSRMDTSREEIAYVGKTAWTSRNARKARIELSYVDQSTARTAIAKSAAALNAALLAR